MRGSLRSPRVQRGAGIVRSALESRPEATRRRYGYRASVRCVRYASLLTVARSPPLAESTRCALRYAPRLRICCRCESPRGRSMRHREGAYLWWWLATGRHAPLRSLYRAARPSSPRVPCARGNFLAFAPRWCAAPAVGSSWPLPPRVGLAPCPLPPSSPLPSAPFGRCPAGGVMPPLCFGSAPLGGWGSSPRGRSSSLMPHASVPLMSPSPSPLAPLRSPLPSFCRSSVGRCAPSLLALLVCKR